MKCDLAGLKTYFELGSNIVSTDILSGKSNKCDKEN